MALLGSPGWAPFFKREMRAESLTVDVEYDLAEILTFFVVEHGDHLEPLARRWFSS